MTDRIKLKSANEHFTDAFDLLICCASYEERSTSLPCALESGKVVEVLIFKNLELGEFALKNIQTLSSHFGKAADVVEISSHEPIDTADAIINSIQQRVQKNPTLSLLIDVTTFTRESLLILVRALHELKLFENRVEFTYVPAKEMSRSWLTESVRECRSVLGYSGGFNPSRKMHLIVMLGFEVERARAIIDHYEPSSLSVGVGAKDESITDDFHTRNEKFLRELKQHMGEDLNTFEFSPSDPKKTLFALDQQFVAHKNSNIALAPLNTKVSVLGAAFAGIKNKHIQVCYAEMELYNMDEYSVPSDSFMYFTIEELNRAI